VSTARSAFKKFIYNSMQFWSHRIWLTRKEEKLSRN